LQATFALDSYLYLPDKNIKEEIPIGSFVIDLAKELDSNPIYKKQISPNNYKQPQSVQFTLLDDAKQTGFFNLDASSGIMTTKRSIDREQMCMNRQCADPCDPGYIASPHHSHTNVGACRVNLKVLMMPSYNILNLNVLIDDINDNKPAFRVSNLTQQVNENVPVGYKIPIDLAFDPDFGINSVQNYELKSNVEGVNQGKFEWLIISCDS
jgi:hypothetical protein